MMRMTTFSPYLPGMVLTRRSIGRLSIMHVDAAVLRQAALGDIQAGHDLDARRRRRRASGTAGAAFPSSRPSMR